MKKKIVMVFSGIVILLLSFYMGMYYGALDVRKKFLRFYIMQELRTYNEARHGHWENVQGLIAFDLYGKTRDYRQLEENPFTIISNNLAQREPLSGKSFQDLLNVVDELEADLRRDIDDKAKYSENFVEFVEKYK